MAGRTAESEAPLRRALELAPQLESARLLLAEALMMLGRIDESAAQYRELLQQHPHSGQAWWGLANLKSVRLDADDVGRLQALVRRRDLPDAEQLTARFALAKALDDTARHAEAFHAYVDANALARRGFRWDAAGFARWMEHLRATFERSAYAPADVQFGAEAIFVVGLPRSASTLTEQILAAHPQVEGASELGDLGAVIREESRRRARAFPDWVADAGAADWRRLGERYLERTARWRERRPRFTDKAPANWMLTAAIRRMLPGARIVDCRRDPLETCWSCFRQIFWREHEYSYDLGDLAAYWARARRGDAALVGGASAARARAGLRGAAGRSGTADSRAARFLWPAVRRGVPALPRSRAQRAHRERGAGASTAEPRHRAHRALRRAARSAAARAGALRRRRLARVRRRLAAPAHCAKSALTPTLSRERERAWELPRSPQGGLAHLAPHVEESRAGKEEAFTSPARGRGRRASRGG